jgi:hypothetical protein
VVLVYQGKDMLVVITLTAQTMELAAVVEQGELVITERAETQVLADQDLPRQSQDQV